MLFTLKLISGEVVQHNLKSGVVTIGRSKNCSIVAPYEGISRHHCQIDFQDGEIFVTDLDSTNGVFIDGTKIEPNVKTHYQTYLTLSVGSVQSITIEFDDKTGIQSQNTFETLQGGGQKPSQLKQDTQLTKTTAYAPPPISTNSEIKVKSKRSTPQNTSATQTSIKIPSKKKEKKNTLLTNIVAVLLLIGAIAWYATKDENNEAISNPEDTISPERDEKNFEQF
jgi:pSer/pThr/pTyr-binding forkhead associated (FHA) protein